MVLWIVTLFPDLTKFMDFILKAGNTYHWWIYKDMEKQTLTLASGD